MTLSGTAATSRGQLVQKYEVKEIRLTVFHSHCLLGIVPVSTNAGTEALCLAIDVEESTFASILTSHEVLVIEAVVVADFILVPFTDV